MKRWQKRRDSSLSTSLLSGTAGDDASGPGILLRRAPHYTSKPCYARQETPGERDKEQHFGPHSESGGAPPPSTSGPMTGNTSPEHGADALQDPERELAV
jgi:hypothetical protein